MKKFWAVRLKCLGLVLVLFLLGLEALPSAAFVSEIKILEKKDIIKLTDDILGSSYLDVIIELEAITLYHRTAGFTPKEYQQYKDLLKYCYDLKVELQKRQLDIPVIENNHNQ